jgi:hypothetical protein
MVLKIFACTSNASQRRRSVSTGCEVVVIANSNDPAAAVVDLMASLLIVHRWISSARRNPI